MAVNCLSQILYKDLQQKSDEPVSQFLQPANSIAIELNATGHPLHPNEFNLHISRGLKSEFRDMSWPVCQLNVHNVFLHGKLNEELYLSQPQGFVDASHPTHDLGDLHFFLGIEAIPHSKGLLLSQSRYISDFLKKTGTVDCKPDKTPMATTQKQSAEGGAPMSDPTLYRSVVGALQYATLTLSDDSFAVNHASQFMHAPTEVNWQLVKRILRYLKSTCTSGLLLEHSSSRSLQAVSYADWAGDGFDRKSTRGFAIFLGPNLISWTSCKQHIVARSSTKAEYKALADASAELVWLESLFRELGYPLSSAPVL
ncbi:uncharacterized mitochondrial protein AtMg00810-like [Telopea speciosissima]|uniref:uncharacterized mitochondrial protein AtMg00810-like n=1 Tax=Telopea speciosissima TaxID=54955 RepID=UPI001CC49E97|nr:uncharacterized mitochondrial protein AtMg00810-like [Telopea speciosissima]